MSAKQDVNLYIRYNLPEPYVSRCKELCTNVILEPWIYGNPEPETQADLSDCNVVFTLGLHDSLQIRKKAPHIKWVQSISVGLDALLNEEVKNSDILITNTKGCTSIPIAEHTIAMISSLARGIPTLLRNQVDRTWEMVPVTELMNSTVGIIGYGEIGYEIAKRCKAMGMRVIGCRRNPDKKREMEPAESVVGLDRVDEVIMQSDFLVLALPSTRETYHFFDKDRFSKMKQGSFFLNVGRGNTIVEEDLVESIQTKHIAGAALDVFDVEPLPADHPLWQLENLIISPHNAYYSPKSMERYMEIFLQNLKLFQEGKPLLNKVNKQIGY